jgi:hypothetical protein
VDAERAYNHVRRLDTGLLTPAEVQYSLAELCGLLGGYHVKRERTADYISFGDPQMTTVIYDRGRVVLASLQQYRRVLRRRGTQPEVKETTQSEFEKAKETLPVELQAQFAEYAVQHNANDRDSGEVAEIDPNEAWRLLCAFRKDRDLKEDVRGRVTNGVFYPANSLGVARQDMPQLKRAVIDQFLGELDKEGVRYRLETMSVETLKPSQREVALNVVDNTIQRHKAGEDINSNPLNVSKDGYIADGHNRWYAAYKMDPQFKLRVRRIELPIRALLLRMEQFGQAHGLAHKGLAQIGSTPLPAHEAVDERGMYSSLTAYAPLESVGDPVAGGYDTDHNRSNRATDALQRGLVTSSVLAKRIGKGVDARHVEAVLLSREAHHFGGNFQLRAMYRPEDLTPELEAKIIARAEAEKKEREAGGFLADVEWLEWPAYSPRARHRQPPTSVSYKGARVQIKGQTATIIHADLPQPVQKRLTTKGFSFRRVSEAVSGAVQVKGSARTPDDVFRKAGAVTFIVFRDGTVVDGDAKTTHQQLGDRVRATPSGTHQADLWYDKFVVAAGRIYQGVAYFWERPDDAVLDAVVSKFGVERACYYNGKNEAVSEAVDDVLVDPSREDVVSLLKHSFLHELRGVLVGKQLAVASAGSVTHWDLASAISRRAETTGDFTRFYVSKLTVYCAKADFKAVQKHPGIQRLGFDVKVDPAMRQNDWDENVAEEIRHAPAGGTTVSGKRYKGGQFTPGQGTADTGPLVRNAQGQLAWAKKPTLPFEFKSLFAARDLTRAQRSKASYKTESEAYERSTAAFQSWKVLLDLGKGVVAELGDKARDIYLDSPEKMAQLGEMLEQPGPLVVIGGLKGRARAREKVNTKYRGDWSRLHDIVRATVAVDTFAEIPAVVAAVSKHMQKTGWTLATVPEDRFTQPTDAGYMDAVLKLRSPSGVIAELQVNVKSMLKAKEGLGRRDTKEEAGHHLYERVRSITAQVELEKREMTAAEADEVVGLRERMQVLYAKAYVQATRSAQESLSEAF